MTMKRTRQGAMGSFAVRTDEFIVDIRKEKKLIAENAEAAAWASSPARHYTHSLAMMIDSRQLGMNELALDILTRLGAS